MEIERKFLVNLDKNPYDLSNARCHFIEQAYLCTAPVVRIRKEDDNYYLTYKSKGKNAENDKWMLAHEEYNLPLNETSYIHLRQKADGNVITKKRYVLPINNQDQNEPKLFIELDIFEGKFDGLVLAEVEFPDVETAEKFVMPEWFTEDVTYDSRYHNSVMSKMD